MSTANGDDSNVLLRIEALLQQLVVRTSVKSFYTVEDFAQLVDRSEHQVRQWCNLGRINASKSEGRCGGERTWVISHEEYERYQRAKLLPLDPGRNNPDRPMG
jgi:hypothetical protein